jgi:hypothetical protein
MAKSRLYKCEHCNVITWSSTNLRKHNSKFHTCYKCYKYYKNPQLNHFCSIQTGRGINLINLNETRFKLYETALKELFLTFCVSTEKRHISIEQLFREYRSDFVNLFVNVLLARKSFKVRIVFTTLLYNNNTQEEAIQYLSSKTGILLNRTQINRLLHNATSDIIHNLNIFVQNGMNLHLFCDWVLI